MASVYFVIPPTTMGVSHLWVTSIQTTINGTEKRSALTTWPRIKFEGSWFFTNDTDINTAKRNLLFYPDSIWGVPLWPDKTVLTSQALASQKTLLVSATANRHFYVGRECIIIKTDYSSYEVGTIASMTATSIVLESNLSSTWAASSYIIPLYEFRLEATQYIDMDYIKTTGLQLVGHEAYETLRSFTYTLPASSATTYKALDVFSFIPVRQLKYKYYRPYDMVQFFGLGVATQNYKAGDNAIEAQGRYVFTTREQTWNFLKFFDSKMGRLSSFWMPTWQRDVVPSAAIAADATVITINPIDYALYLANDIIGRYIMFVMPDGTYQYRKITDADATTITIESALGTAITTAQLTDLIVSFIHYARFEVDEVKMDFSNGYNVDGMSRTEATFKVILNEDLQGSASESPSNSPSASPSSSVSPSESPSASASVSPSVSPSASASKSPSASKSTSPSKSPSVSPSASVSSSPSVSPSESSSISPSVSPSASASISPSVSPSTSPSIVPSSSLSPSVSPSLSPSASVSPSSSPSESASLSPSVSPSVSPSQAYYCSWATTSTLNVVGRSQLTGCGTTNDALAIGGYHATNKTEKWNGSAWATTSNLVKGRSSLGSCGTTSAALVFGGLTGLLYTDETEIWNGSVWATTSLTSEPYLAPSSCGTTSSALLFNGLDDDFISTATTTEIWDGSVWATTSALNSDRSVAAGCGDSSNALSIGGWLETFPSYASFVEKWNGSVWTVTNALPEGRSQLAASGTTSAALAFGGQPAGSVESTTSWNGSSWATTTAMNAARHDLAGCGDSESALSIGGDMDYGLQVLTEKWTCSEGSPSASPSPQPHIGSWVTMPALNIESFDMAGCGTTSAALAFGGDTSYDSTEIWNGSVWATTSKFTSYRAAGAGSGNTSNALSFGGTTGDVIGVTEIWAGSSWATTTALVVSAYVLAGCGTTSATLAFGGSSNNFSTPIATTQIWSGSAWATTTVMNTARFFFSGCGTTSSIISCGGSTDGDYTMGLSVTEIWNGSSWVTTNGLNKQSMGVASSGTTSAALCFGGDTKAYSVTTEIWNGTSWTTTVSLNVKRMRLAGCGSITDTLSFGGGTTEKWSAEPIPSLSPSASPSASPSISASASPSISPSLSPSPSLGAYRYYRVTITSGPADTLIAMSRLEIWGASSKLNTELMSHWASSTLNGQAQNCSDGLETSYWQFYKANLPVWWKVDLGSSQVMSQFKSKCLTGYSRNMREFTIAGSNDNSNWTDLWTDNTGTDAFVEYTHTF